MVSAYRGLTSFVDFVITLVTALLGLRVLLRLFGADSASGFARAIYAVSAPFVAPFAGIFPSLTLENGFVLEFATLFALVVYAMIAHLVLTLIRALAYSAFRRRIALRRHQQRAV